MVDLRLPPPPTRTVCQKKASSSRSSNSGSCGSNSTIVLLLVVVVAGGMVVLNAALLVAWWPQVHAPLVASSTTDERQEHQPDDNDDDGKERVRQILRDAGVSESVLQRHGNNLPTWKSVTDQFGDAPVVVGLDTACAAFRESVLPVDRLLGAAGMFDTGTNLVTQLLKQNCVIPERLAQYGRDATKEQLGVRWQVPWGKHTPQHYRAQHSTEHARDIRKEHVLPVVTVRNPWRWMQAMCKNPYAAKWTHHTQCPNLKVTDTDDGGNEETNWNGVTVKYGAATETYMSLAHLWNDWYNDYYQTAALSYPWIMVRMEDLIFHTVSTITQVCECAGGQVRTDRPFHYIVQSAKADNPAGVHDTSTGLAEAWIKYSQRLEPGAGFSESDHAAARQVLDPQLMQLLGYEHPPSND